MTQITVQDLQDATFDTVWFKGYESRAVDRLLDDATETLAQKEREIAVLLRLRDPRTEVSFFFVLKEITRVRSIQTPTLVV